MFESYIGIVPFNFPFNFLFNFRKFSKYYFVLVCFSLMLSPKKLCKDTKNFRALRIIEQKSMIFYRYQRQCQHQLYNLKT